MEIINDLEQFTPVWVLLFAFTIYYLLYHTRVGKVICNFFIGIIESL
jgi:hypothetical protein